MDHLATVIDYRNRYSSWHFVYSIILSLYFVQCAHIVILLKGLSWWCTGCDNRFSPPPWWSFVD